MSGLPDLNPKGRGVVLFPISILSSPEWTERHPLKVRLERAESMIEALSSRPTLLPDMPHHTPENTGQIEVLTCGWDTKDDGIVRATIKRGGSELSIDVFDDRTGRRSTSFVIETIEPHDEDGIHTLVGQTEESIRLMAIACLELMIEAVEALLEDVDHRIRPLKEIMRGAACAVMDDCASPDALTTMVTARTPWSRGSIWIEKRHGRPLGGVSAEQARAERTIARQPACLEVEPWLEGIKLIGCETSIRSDGITKDPMARMRAIAAYDHAAREGDPA
jgi:hypothetical protein